MKVRRKYDKSTTKVQWKYDEIKSRGKYDEIGIYKLGGIPC